MTYINQPLQYPGRFRSSCMTFEFISLFTLRFTGAAR